MDATRRQWVKVLDAVERADKALQQAREELGDIYDLDEGFAESSFVTAKTWSASVVVDDIAKSIRANIEAIDYGASNAE